MDNKEIKKIIKERFTQYQHSFIVLTRAVKSCQNKTILEYLNKKLEEEPKWENIYNIVYGILTDKELPTCKFCHKTLSYSALLKGQQYCSQQCEHASKGIEITSTTTSETKSEKVEQEETSSTSSTNIFQKILSIFNIFKKRK